MPPAFAVIVFDVLVLALIFSGIATLRYELRDEGLCVVIFGFALRRIPYDNIESVRRGGAWWNEHWNRLSLDPCITLRLKRGWVRNFVINPPQTETFMEQLRARL